MKEVSWNAKKIKDAAYEILKNKNIKLSIFDLDEDDFMQTVCDSVYDYFRFNNLITPTRFLLVEENLEKSVENAVNEFLKHLDSVKKRDDVFMYTWYMG